MTFPTITHISDVLPHVTGRSDFIVAERSGYIYIDYLYAAEDTFSGPGAEYRRECRGIKFHPDGRLMARPLHKFKNVGESEETQPHVLPWGEPHHVLTKRDGSMIHTATVDGEIRLMTRAGLTETAKQAEDWLRSSPLWSAYHRFFVFAEKHGMTPIFEYTSPRNRIVVKYEDDALTLLALRGKYTGAYITYDSMCGMARAFNISAVDAWDISTADVPAFLSYIADLKGEEGVIVRWHDGRMVKIKALEYLSMHRARDGLQHEKNVLEIVLRDKDDDVVAMLPVDESSRLCEYAGTVRRSIARIAAETVEFASNRASMDRREFATKAVPLLPRRLQAVAWAAYDGRDALGTLKSLLLKQCGSQTQVDEIREIIGATW
jgi:RNA ligase